MSRRLFLLPLAFGLSASAAAVEFSVKGPISAVLLPSVVAYMQCQDKAERDGSPDPVASCATARKALMEQAPELLRANGQSAEMLQEMRRFETNLNKVDASMQRAIAKKASLGSAGR